MQSLARRPLFNEFLLPLCAVVIQCTLALGQRPIVHPGYPPGAVVHIPTPPILRTPIYQAPMYHPPVYQSYRPAVMYASPRNPVIHPFRPKPPVIFIYAPTFAVNNPFWQFGLCWWTPCDLFWPSTVGYTTFSSPGPTNYVSQVYENPVYVYGYEREDTPQLYLTDGTIVNVTDYWVTDSQLHFTTIEQIGAKPAAHSIPFDELDLQKTIDANSARGFRFVLRNEPFDQYVKDHPDGPPPDAVPHRE